MEPDRQKLGEDIARQIERLYMMIDSVAMLPNVDEHELVGARSHIGLGAMMLAHLVQE
jgi:hypothetical protein